MTELHKEERQNVRIAFILTPTWAALLDDAVEAAGVIHRGTWVRRLVGQALEGTDVDRGELPEDVVDCNWN